MKKWFTLVEMLIVVVIIWILAAALIPRLVWAQSQARDVARKAGIAQLMVGLSRYYNEYWMYPFWDCTYYFDWSYINIPNAYAYWSWDWEKEADWTDTFWSFHKPDNNLVRLNIISDIPKDTQKWKINYWTWINGCSDWYWGYRNFSTGWGSVGTRRSYSYFLSANMENYKNMNYVFPSSVLSPSTMTLTDLWREGWIENFKAKVCSKVEQGNWSCQTNDIKLWSYLVFWEEK